jgi:hypothetical protein
MPRAGWNGFLRLSLVTHPDTPSSRPTNASMLARLNPSVGVTILLNHIS